MIDTIAILFCVLAVTAILVAAAKYEKIKTEEGVKIYLYSKVIKSIMAVAVIFFPLGLVLDYMKDYQHEMHVIILYILLNISAFVALAYFFGGKVFLLDKAIIKRTPFRTVELPYKEVAKIVVYQSKGNPGAAMTRVYGKKKITLEAMLVGYEELVDELRFRCKNAEIIEK